LVYRREGARFFNGILLAWGLWKMDLSLCQKNRMRDRCNLLVGLVDRGQLSVFARCLQ